MESDKLITAHYKILTKDTYQVVQLASLSISFDIYTRISMYQLGENTNYGLVSTTMFAGSHMQHDTKIRFDNALELPAKALQTF